MGVIELEDGKYKLDGRWVYRYGEAWRDTTGDKFIGAMANEIEQLRAELAAVKQQRDELVDALEIIREEPSIKGVRQVVRATLAKVMK